jgi:hypothetical protein
MLYILPQHTFQLFFMAVSNGAHIIKPRRSILSFLTTTHFPCSCNQASPSQYFNPLVNYPLQVHLMVRHYSRIIFETEPPRLRFCWCTKTPSFACSLIPASQCLNPHVHYPLYIPLTGTHCPPADCFSELKSRRLVVGAVHPNPLLLAHPDLSAPQPTCLPPQFQQVHAVPRCQLLGRTLTNMNVNIGRSLPASFMRHPVSNSNHFNVPLGAGANVNLKLQQVQWSDICHIHSSCMGSYPFAAYSHSENYLSILA